MPPPPGPHDGLPAPKPHWAALDQMKDEDVLRFAPPEIRRIWKRIESLELQLDDIRKTLGRIESLLSAPPARQP